MSDTHVATVEIPDETPSHLVDEMFDRLDDGNDLPAFELRISDEETHGASKYDIVSVE